MSVLSNRVDDSKMGSAAEELAELRAWRLLFAEAHGQLRGIDEFRGLAGMQEGDALSAIGLGGSAWASEHLGELRRALK